MLGFAMHSKFVERTSVTMPQSSQIDLLRFTLCDDIVLLVDHTVEDDTTNQHFLFLQSSDTLYRASFNGKSSTSSINLLHSMSLSEPHLDISLCHRARCMTPLHAARKCAEVTIDCHAQAFIDV